MLIHPTRDKLHALKLTGRLKALDESHGRADIEALSFEERRGLLVDRELLERDNPRLTARLRQTATLEDIDDRYPRGLDRA